MYLPASTRASPHRPFRQRRTADHGDPEPGGDGLGSVLVRARRECQNSLLRRNIRLSAGAPTSWHLAHTRIFPVPTAIRCIRARNGLDADIGVHRVVAQTTRNGEERCRPGIVLHGTGPCEVRARRRRGCPPRSAVSIRTCGATRSRQVCQVGWDVGAEGVAFDRAFHVAEMVRRGSVCFLANNARSAARPGRHGQDRAEARSRAMCRCSEGTVAASSVCNGGLGRRPTCPRGARLGHQRVSDRS
jgi:hypothetical protein